MGDRYRFCPLHAGTDWDVLERVNTDEVILEGVR